MKTTGMRPSENVEVRAPEESEEQAKAKRDAIHKRQLAESNRYDPSEPAWLTQTKAKLSGPITEQEKIGKGIEREAKKRAGDTYEYTQRELRKATGLPSMSDISAPEPAGTSDADLPSPADRTDHKNKSYRRIRDD